MNNCHITDIKLTLEAALLAANEPLSITQLQKLFDPIIDKHTVKMALDQLTQDYIKRAFECVELANGFCLRVKSRFSPMLVKLHQQKPPRYSRAFLETLAIIAYRQPITRAEIEDIRGVSTNSQVIKALLEQEWITVAGQKDLPGRPEILVTTKRFLDYFHLKSLTELPVLQPEHDFESGPNQLEIFSSQTNLTQDTSLNFSKQESITVTINQAKDTTNLSNDPLTNPETITNDA